MAEGRRSPKHPEARATLRARAIWFALKYGVLPWWTYEAECHYPAEGTSGYLAHLRLNLGLAWRWATFTESSLDVEFEREVNGRLPLFRDVRLAPMSRRPVGSKPRSVVALAAGRPGPPCSACQSRSFEGASPPSGPRPRGEQAGGGGRWVAPGTRRDHKSRRRR